MYQFQGGVSEKDLETIIADLKKRLCPAVIEKTLPPVS
jgi:hypothetical protein